MCLSTVCLSTVCLFSVCSKKFRPKVFYSFMYTFTQIYHIFQCGPDKISVNSFREKHKYDEKNLQKLKLYNILNLNDQVSS